MLKEILKLQKNTCFQVLAGSFYNLKFEIHLNFNMHIVFSTDILKSEQVNCPECTWKGKGSDTEQEYLFLTDAIELYCPCCKNYLGFINQED
jgi:hypothetical protein